MGRLSLDWGMRRCCLSTHFDVHKREADTRMVLHAASLANDHKTVIV